VDIGSSFLSSEITAAFLYAQLENLDNIQTRRKALWDIYFKELEILKRKEIGLPFFPVYSTNNAHMFYLVFTTLEQRSKIINKLKENGIMAVFHYLSLHKSPFYQSKHDNRAPGIRQIFGLPSEVTIIF
jgi:dTDP-4-amino-4,6-dideoxygalactose transaminase